MPRKIPVDPHGPAGAGDSIAGTRKDQSPERTGSFHCTTPRDTREGNRLMSRIASGHALLPRTPSPERPRRLWKVALEHPAFCDVVTGLRWFYTAIQPDKRGFSTSTGIIGHLWRREWATGQGDRDANPLRSTSPHSTRRTQLALEVGPAVSHP